ncbi:lantibiotic modifying enzyme [Weissella uvarum]|uniref:lanthionine synthetase LanC family protein n=1 Tax=Weissella uvarum TaxID=1479233 RepID=UPI001960506F|nr:lanthionine synthetase LanC family protein [Weissella uvarum]MBM7617386.1 lantibiotic modifying enzyme [Weissella uvarum]MCM0595729.1 hypothetical protein [Weissella uvarum]
MNRNDVVLNRLVTILGDFNSPTNFGNDFSKETSIFGQKINLWNPSSLMGGRAGLLLLFTHPEFPIDVDLNEQLLDLLNHISLSNGLSLFDGLIGDSLALDSVKRDDLDNVKSQLMQAEIQNMEFMLDVSKNEAFDFAYGVVGIGMYVLSKLDHVEDNENTQKLVDLLANMQNYLIEKFPAQKNNSQKIKKWSFSRFQTEPIDIDFSMSHGLAGVLTFLADSTMKLGHRDEVDSVICSLLSFFNDMSYIQDGIECWPQSIGQKEFVRNDSWCYGTPGIEIARIKANLVLGNSKDARSSLTNLKNTIEHPQGLDNAMICHGYAGLKVIADVINNISSFEFISTNEVVSNINNFYSYDIDIGYLNPKISEDGQVTQTADFGMLTGIAGIAYALLPYKTTNFEYALGINMNNYEMLISQIIKNK